MRYEASNVGRNIRKLRLAAGMTRVDLVNAMDTLDPNAVWKYETSKVLPSLPTLIRLADALDCSMEDLFC